MGSLHQIKIPKLILLSLGIYLLSKLAFGLGRSSDWWIFLLSAPSRAVSSSGLTAQWLFAEFVPTHSGGSVPESHRLPFFGLQTATDPHRLWFLYATLCGDLSRPSLPRLHSSLVRGDVLLSAFRVIVASMSEASAVPSSWAWERLCGTLPFHFFHVVLASQKL